jgi:hypothetical protein
MLAIPCRSVDTVHGQRRLTGHARRTSCPRCARRARPRTDQSPANTHNPVWQRITSIARPAWATAQTRFSISCRPVGPLDMECGFVHS